MNLWQRKLLAFLHDPPSKPLNIREHGEIAESLIRAAGFDDPAQVGWFFDKICDHTAAAADRLAFPRPKPGGLVCDFTGGPDSPFHHPLGGGALPFEQPITATQAEDLIANAQPAYLDATREAWSEEADLWRARFFLHWRLWRHSASVSRGPAQGDGRLAFLPADTRIPDHSTWNHCSLVSALQSCVEIDGEGDRAEIRDFRPAFLLVQIGPVQEFIAQARTTRDLWSGSYLLSWLIAHGIKAVTGQVGPDCVLFPSLWAQPLFDFLHRDEIFKRIKTADGRELWDEFKPSDAQILTPNLPNRFLALVPQAKAETLSKAAAGAMRDALNEIGSACLDWLQKENHRVNDDARVRWDQQLRQFLAVTWQTWPWEMKVQTAVNDLATLPAGKAPNDAGRAVYESLQAALDAARKGIARDDLDPRNYRHKNYRTNGAFRSEIIPDSDGLPHVDNAGFAWAAHYASTDFLLAARRNTRDFDAWGDPNDEARLRGATRDGLSGKEEIIGTVDWQEGLANLPGHHFKAGEQLGAISIVKRLWHVAFLERKHGLERKRVRFDSVPAVAAASFVVRVLERTTQGQVRNIFTDDFAPKAGEAREFFGGIADWLGCKEQQWLELTDASVFHISEWDRALREEEKRPGGPRLQAQVKLQAARDALARLLGQDGLNQRPSSYYAVLALDGDEMGKWVSGAKSPLFREQLARAAVGYFEKAQAGAFDPEALRRLLYHPRHLSPSYHLQFSEALCNFSVHLAPAIVEFYDGQIIYSGGDDVLAMLPAANAVACAAALRLAFRGELALFEHLKRHVGNDKTPVLIASNGFVSLDAEWPGFKAQGRSVPRGVHLLVPGLRATVSVGLAIGHMKEPLQDMIREAQAAEKRAKNKLGRNALAVTLFKRSGETIDWGCKFSTNQGMTSAALELLQFVQSGNRYRRPLDQPDFKPPISGKFPYRVAELLRRYQNYPTTNGLPDYSKPEPLDAELRQIALREFDWVIKQQAEKLPGEDKIELARLAALCLDEIEQGRLPLLQFIHLFALEAFIARTGE
jgi:CRISPR-associated protein Cmr2